MAWVFSRLALFISRWILHQNNVFKVLLLLVWKLLSWLCCGAHVIISSSFFLSLWLFFPFWPKNLSLSLPPPDPSRISPPSSSTLLPYSLIFLFLFSLHHVLFLTITIFFVLEGKSKGSSFLLLLVHVWRDFWGWGLVIPYVYFPSLLSNFKVKLFRTWCDFRIYELLDGVWCLLLVFYS